MRIGFSIRIPPLFLAASYYNMTCVYVVALTNPNIDAHDWWQLFNMMNCMNRAELIAGVTHWIGVLIYAASIIFGVYAAYLHQQTMNDQQRRREARLRGEKV